MFDKQLLFCGGLMIVASLLHLILGLRSGRTRRVTRAEMPLLYWTSMLLYAGGLCFGLWLILAVLFPRRMGFPWG